MTVCNKCKVDVSDCLTKCPLCHTVLKEDDDYENTSVYSRELENFSRKVNIKYFASLIIKLLIFMTSISVLCNLLINKELSWSLYVVFSCGYICSYYIFLRSNNLKISLLVNLVSLELLLFAISYLTNGLNWFLYLVGPFILLFYMFIIMNLLLAKLKNILRNFSYYLMYIGSSLFIINGLINLYKDNKFYLNWSIYSNIPIFIISFLLFGLSFNKKIQNEFEKRFFI